jgi:hypothetical protein
VPDDQCSIRTAMRIGSIRMHRGGTTQPLAAAGSSSVAHHTLAAAERTSVAKTPWKLAVKADEYLSSM